MRTFDTGATRDSEDGKLDYEGFLSPRVLRRYAEYMHRKRKTPKGIRSADNWQKGIPEDVYLKSLIRHTMQLWEAERERVVPELELGEDGFHTVEEYIEETLCAIMFNAMGLLYEKGIHAEDLRFKTGDFDAFVDEVFSRAGLSDDGSSGGALDPGVDEQTLPNRTSVPEESFAEHCARASRAIAEDVERYFGDAYDDVYLGDTYDDEVYDPNHGDGGGRDAED